MVNRGPAPPYYKLRIHTYSTYATLLPKCLLHKYEGNLSSLASLGNLMRLVVFLHEGGKSIPAKRYRHFSHKTATRVGGRLDEPEAPLGGVAAGGVVVPKYVPVVWPEGRVSRRLPRTYVWWHG